MVFLISKHIFAFDVYLVSYIMESHVLGLVARIQHVCLFFDVSGTVARAEEAYTRDECNYNRAEPSRHSFALMVMACGGENERSQVCPLLPFFPAHFNYPKRSFQQN